MKVDWGSRLSFGGSLFRFHLPMVGQFPLSTTPLCPESLLHPRLLVLSRGFPQPQPQKLLISINAPVPLSFSTVFSIADPLLPSPSCVPPRSLPFSLFLLWFSSLIKVRVIHASRHEAGGSHIGGQPWGHSSSIFILKGTNTFKILRFLREFPPLIWYSYTVLIWQSCLFEIILCVNLKLSYLCISVCFI